MPTNVIEIASESTTHFVAHSVREIESAMRDVLKPLTKSEESSIKVKSNEKHKDTILRILNALDIPLDGSVAQAWLGLAGDKNAGATHARAHRNALASPRSIGPEFREFWDNVQTVLDLVLEKLEARFLVFFKILDGLLKKEVPEDNDLKILNNNVPNNLVTRTYFFDRLSSPKWLVPLRENGFFKNPIEPKKDEDNNIIGFSPWPESRYLARMAAHEPEIILQISLDIAPTANIRVHEDLIDAALNMPPDLSVAFFEDSKTWIEASYASIRPEKLSALISHLVKGRQVTAALDLARIVLAILPDPRLGITNEKNEAYRSSPRPQARFDLWHYQQVLKKTFPELVAAAGQDAFKLLCDLLNSEIQLSRRRGDDTGPEDYSFVSRPHIDSQKHHDFGDALITAIRSTAIQIVRSDSTQLAKLIFILETNYDWHIFKRISLHLLSIFPNEVPALVEERLLNLELMDDGWCQNEYLRLLKNSFSGLSYEVQLCWLDLIRQGPPQRPWRKKDDIPPEELEQEAIRWRRKRLEAVADQLPIEWKEQNPVWTEGLTVPNDFAPTRSRSWVGPTSPKTSHELEVMSIEELLAFLHTWEPSNDHFSPSPQGLSRQLKTVVAENPDRFVENLIQFKDTDPTYIHSIIEGLEEACKEKKNFNWKLILEFCDWISTQPLELTSRRLSGNDLDRDWGWTRKAIGRLLSTGFEEGMNAIPFDSRVPTWKIIKLLTEDPDPTPADEARYGESHMVFDMLSINSVRGQAMETVIRYALWIHRHLQKQCHNNKPMTRGMEEMPEVCEVLNQHLNTLSDSSIAIRGVYGQWFPWLVMLDSKWTESNVSKIFPKENNQQRFLNAAWESYITFCDPHDDAFEILHEEYGHAVERISDFSEGKDLNESEERLIDHLIIFYLRGKIELENPANPLSLLFQKASVKLRAHGIESIGIRLLNEDKKVSSKILQRCEQLWEKRFNVIKTEGSIDTAEELVPFGYWFAARKFDDAWSIHQLLEVLQITKKIAFDVAVIEQLASLASVMPRQVIRCVHLMVEGDQEGWNVVGWRDHIRSILTSTFQGGCKEAEEDATALIHRLSARGHLEFRGFLPAYS